MLPLKRSLLKCLPLLLCAGCCSPDLSLYTRYDTVERLASTHIGTPDPRRLDIQTQGQTLVIHWTIPEKDDGYWVELTRVYRCQERETDAFYLPHLCGRFEIPLRGCTYQETGGYLSYQAILFHRGEAVKVVTHPLFVELITSAREQKQRQIERTTQ